MHIVYISREYPPSMRMGGIASYVRDVAEAMVKRGHRVSVLCASDDTREYREYVENGVEVVRLDGGDFIITSVEKYKFSRPRKLRMLYRFHSYRKKIRNKILELNNRCPIDIIEIADYGAEGLYLMDTGIPITVRLHTPTLLNRETCRKTSFIKIGPLEYYVGLKELKLLRKAKFITACSDALKEATEQNFFYHNKNIETIYNPINLGDTFKFSGKERMPGSILFAGTVAETKGVGDLIDACRILKERGIRINLTIAGKLGSYGNDLAASCKSNDNDTWCNITGHIPRNDLTHLYQQAKVACFPSWWEAFGIVATEAMACGAVVVATDNGGFKEIISDGENGFLVPPRNPKFLADCLEKALNLSEEDRETITSSALNRLNAQLTMETVIPQLENHYQRVIVNS